MDHTQLFTPTAWNSNGKIPLSFALNNSLYLTWSQQNNKIPVYLWPHSHIMRALRPCRSVFCHLWTSHLLHHQSSQVTHIHTLKWCVKECLGRPITLQEISQKKAVIIIRPKYVVSNWICHPLKPHYMLNQSHIRHVNDIMNMIYSYLCDTLTAGLPVKTLDISLWFPMVYQLWLIITHIFALMQAARFRFQSPYMPDLKKWPLVPVWWCQAKQLK